MNVQNMNDWEILCKTTPTVINGVLYEGAMSCVNSVSCYLVCQAGANEPIDRCGEYSVSGISRM